MGSIAHDHLSQEEDSPTCTSRRASGFVQSHFYSIRSDHALTDDIIIQTVTTSSGDVIGVQVTGQDIIGNGSKLAKQEVAPVAIFNMPVRSPKLCY